ncbi:MAG: carboxymuconolactone decarboxylase family protein [Planctomycetota bacterium]
MPLVLDALDALRDRLPDDLKDLRLNAQAVLSGEHLTPAQALGTALAAARFLRCGPLAAALEADLRASLGGDAAAVVSDATAAAGLMAMNTVYFRFRHMVAHGREGKESYASRPARLRMGRMAQPATSKLDFELMSLGCAALAGCEACIQSHEASLVHLGASEEACHDAVRIAAVMSGVACGLDASGGA